MDAKPPPRFSSRNPGTVPSPIAIIGCGRLGLDLATLLHSNSVKDPPLLVGTTTTAERLPELEAAGIQSHLVTCGDIPRLHEILRPCAALVLTLAPRAGRTYRETYLAGVENILTAAPGTSLQQIVYTSSISVYGAGDGSWVDEDTPPASGSDNDRTLLAAETALLNGAADLGITGTVLRLAGLWTDESGPQTGAARLAGTERSNGDSYLNLVHREDVVIAMALALGKPYHGVLNINDNEPTERRVYYDQLLATQGAEPIRWIPPEGTPQRGKRVSNQKAKEILGLKLRHPTHLS